ncbi:MAG: ABC-three component system protein, partial [Prosthecobacter sp.]
MPTLGIPLDPSLDRKIEFNKLPAAIASHLRSRNAEAASVISAYFRYRAVGDKELLGQRFKGLYRTAEVLFSNDTEAQSLIFYQILDHITLQKTRPHQNAAMLLMAYYFESCDIYKEPPPLA